MVTRGVLGRGAARIAVVVAMAAGVGCRTETASPERTIRVAVSTDAPDAFETLRITVFRGNDLKFNKTYGRATIDALPDSLLLKNAMPFTDQGHEIYTPIRVIVQGLSAEGDPVVQRSSELAFVIKTPVLLRMPLCKECFGAMCEPGESCVLGNCVRENLDADSLPEDDGSQSLEGIECPGAPSEP